MQIVVDAGPLNYLILIDAIEVLPKLFDAVALPEAVASELRHPRAPDAVRRWVAHMPSWATVYPAAAEPEGLLRLDAGERAAIALASTQRAELLLMDDREGVLAARSLGLNAVGTIGVLDRAAKRGLIELETAVSRLRQTNFRGSPQLYSVLLGGPKAPGR